MTAEGAAKCFAEINNEEKIRDRIEAHLKAGATHVCILPIRVDNESLPDLRAKPPPDAQASGSSYEAW